MPRRSPEIVEKLVLLGFEELEARAYVALFLGGASQVGALAGELGIGHEESARLLDHLAAVGYATRSASKPPTYTAVRPEQVLDASRESHQRALEVLARLRPGLLRSFNEVGPALKAATAVRIVQGRADVRAASQDLAAACTKTLLAVSCAPYTIQPGYAQAALDTMAALVRRGVAMRTIIWDTDEVRDALKGLQIPPGVILRLYASPDAIRFSVYDRKSVLAGIQTDPSPDLDAPHDVVMVSTSPEMVHRHEILFEHMWSAAKPISLG